METQHTALPEAAPLPLPPSQEPQGLGVKKSGDGGRYKERFLLLKKKNKRGRRELITTEQCDDSYNPGEVLQPPLC